MSLFIPGAGQMYKGKVGAGICWFIFTLMAYAALIVPGMIVHIVCVLDAALTTA